MDKMFCIIAVVFLLMGFYLRTGKGDILLRGFVRDLRTKADRFDMPRLRRFVAQMTNLCALSFAIMALGAIVSVKLIVWAGILLFMAVMFYAARYTANDENFSKEGRDHDRF